MKKIIYCFSLAALMLILLPVLYTGNTLLRSVSTIAQENDQCTEQINSADEAYQAGKWNEAIDLIQQCLKKPNVSEIEKGRAYRLLGLVYIAIQLEKEANDAVKNLLIMVPNYKIDPDRDPPSLQKIIDEMSRTLNPKISSLSPNQADQGGEAFILTVNGSNFVYGSGVRFNGTPRTTTYISATELEAQITADDISLAGEYEITVHSPITGGKTSNPVKLEVIKASKFPWTWIAIGGGAVVATVVAVLALSGSDDEESQPSLADPPARP